MPKDLPSPELLRKLLRYEPDTGKLFWKERPVELFVDAKKPEQICASWNARFAGKQALTHVQDSGYSAGSVEGKSLRAHRVAYAIHYGRWPVDQLDHIDHNRSNNAIKNLREASNTQNARNRKRSSRNNTGVTGVVFSKDLGKYLAYVGVGGKSKYLGCFDTLKDAAETRKKANQKYGFHGNHGRNTE